MATRLTTFLTASSFLLLTLTSSLTATTVDARPTIGAWFPDWTSTDLSTVRWSDYDELEFFVGVTTPDPGKVEFTGMEEAEEKKAYIRHFTALALQNGVTPTLSVGGWTGSRYVGVSLFAARVEMQLALCFLTLCLHHAPASFSSHRQWDQRKTGQSLQRHSQIFSMDTGSKVSVSTGSIPMQRGSDATSDREQMQRTCWLFSRWASVAEQEWDIMLTTHYARPLTTTRSSEQRLATKRKFLLPCPW